MDRDVMIGKRQGEKRPPPLQEKYKKLNQRESIKPRI